MRLSKNFTLEELIESQTGRRHVVTEQFLPSEAVKENLKKLCENLLQPLRDKLGQPIKVNSGFRCKRVNKLVGGVSSSQHIEGKAVDIEGVLCTNRELFNLIKDNFKFDQLLWEFGTKDEPAWVHVSWDSKRLRNEIKYIGVK
jgi:zinc D-Ala-D-Ala carboxypeptidase